MSRLTLFTLLAQQRSGTHFVASLLSSHSRLRAYGEVLHPRSANRFHAKHRLLAKDNARSPDVNAWRLFVAGLAARDAIARPGVIAMYNQVLQLPADIMACLVDEAHVIHLIRRNILRTHVSDAINRARLKPAHSREEASLSRILLPVEDLRRQLVLRARTIDVFRRHLADRPHIEIFYEEVVRDPRAQMTAVLVFLGEEPEPLRTDLKPSNPQPLEAILTNFEAVRRALAGTEFEWMCTE